MGCGKKISIEVIYMNVTIAFKVLTYGISSVKTYSGKIYGLTVSH